MINSEKAVIEYLSGKLEIPVYKDIPKDRPEKFVSVEITGGDCREFVANPQLAIQCWDTTEYNASELAIAVSSELENIVYSNNKIYKCLCKVPYSFSDGSGHRYQFMCDLYTA